MTGSGRTRGSAPAASDYIRAAELDTRKGACEEELMAVYEELEEMGE